MSQNPDLPTGTPAEPGLVADINLGLSDARAGYPSYYPPENDAELGDAEIIEGDGDDIDEEVR